MLPVSRWIFPLGLCLLPSIGTAADCPISSFEARCTGDISDGVFFENEVSKVDVFDLTKDIVPSTIRDGVGAVNTVDTGDEGKSIAIEFNSVSSAGFFGIVTKANGVAADSLGTPGKNGSGDNNPFGDATGDEGGRGESAEDASVTFTNGFVSGDGSTSLLLKANSVGGASGNGGDASASGTARGGDSGTAGLSGNASIEVEAGQFLLRKGSNGSVFAVLSEGGAAGAGGSTTSGIPAFGGGGNNGGMAGAASLSVTTATATSNGEVGSMMLVESTGGDAGQGGSSVNRGIIGADATGGDGGNGGQTNGARVSIAAGSFTQNGAGVLLDVLSAGGAGGDGGVAETTNGAATGGVGGRGGAGGTVTLDLNGGSFLVGSAGGTAVLGQSLGGDGGTGGGAQNAPLVDSDDARGGVGGKGGDGGSVTLNGTGTPTSFTVTTSSTSAAQHAVRVESLAGSGGDGGRAVSETLGNGIGGDGGQGGSGGDVNVNFGGTLKTAGNKAQGLFVRSYGGSGGNGGSGTGLSGTGGSGAGSGPGGSVNVTFTGTITTSGDEANAIVAQTVGGFSGNAGAATGFLAFGAGSQSAGDGGTVNVILAEDITTIETKGDSATAVLAQSVGGGGGRGSSGVGLVSLGGSGSAGGNGGDVSLILENGLSVTTSGQGARAIHAGSSGGGGGDGGSAVGIVSLGGSSGSGGDGGSVKIGNSIPLTTLGDQATAFYATSQGGGGGSAHSTVGIASFGGSGGDGGTGGDINAGNFADISTFGADSNGIFLHSVGGGGGDGSSAFSVSPGFSMAFGGSGGGGGDGGKIFYNDSEQFYKVETKGERARGLLAESVGGGGGDGGNAISVSASPDFSISLGGSGDGAKGGDGGAVSIFSAGSFTTAGGNAPALHAQSTGGGGGSAGSTVSSANSAVSITLAVGGSGGGGGHGGTVMVDSTGDLTTKGAVSPGLIAHSTGGGGGHSGATIGGSAGSGIALGMTVGGSGGDGGDGGAVTVTGGGVVATSGDVSPGVYAHSVGGGGGYSGTTAAASGVSDASFEMAVGGSGASGGAGGTVTLDISDQITTAGDISPGVTALSSGGGGGHSGATAAGSGVSSVSANLSVGGNGGGGGDAAAVSVKASEAISTKGHSSAAVTAHSSGGGGGASHFTGAFSGVSDGSVNASVGGSGGVGGNGDSVAVTTGGALSTEGHNAPGISAMSIGGGGGDSGTTVSGALASDAALGVSVGGDGGASGTGGDVSVIATGDISTKGDHSVGIRAMSVSQAGGNAGVVASGSGVSTGNISLSLGGDGGAGGNSGKAVATNSGDITTEGSFASAISVQSQAGGGGSAKGSISANGLSTGSVSVTLGGSGGSGGTANEASALNAGALVTSGHHSHGLLIQSHGGAGGNGGFAAEGSFTAGEMTGQLGVTLGGDGGSGGKGGDIAITSENSIITNDFGSMGILAHSIGGNGGDGGSVYSGNISFGDSASAQVDVDIGGSGGGGATGGSVFISNSADITTNGFLSEGILAQSVGGNGGNGGNTYSVIGGLSTSKTANVSVDVGGGGGTGATASSVEIANSGNILTTKGGSTAIHAQSIGGGGGRGGSAANLNIGLSPTAPAGKSFKANLAFAVGGSGGSGNDGDLAKVENRGGTITTKGERARGIVAHSVGGGGGDGGTASSMSVSVSSVCKLISRTGVFNCGGSGEEEGSEVEVEMSVVVGGNGAGGGDGGEATIINSGDITTEGTVAHAIVAQSHGGGGGNGGDGDLGLEAWTTNATINAIDKSFDAVTEVPSFSSISVAVGGQGGASGDGGKISIDNDGALATSGDHAFGMHLQSIGGGGGNGAAGSSGLWAAGTVGGLGSGGGDGGDIAVTFDGSISTSGEGAIGIFAQSVGGGGGTAGDVDKGLAGSWDNLNIGVGVGVQEDSGAGGDGGAITVTTGGTINTSGETAHGLVLHSVGGTGGAMGITGALASANIDNFIGSVGDDGDGGKIDATIGGAITVTGTQSHAIFAQSVSGTTSGNISGDIDFAIDADVKALGTEGRAILVQSAGFDGGNGNISITVAEGATVETAADGWETIGIRDGNDNRITNRGSIIQQGGVAGEGYVLRTDGVGNLTVVNFGTIEGSVRAALIPPPTAGAAASPPGSSGPEAMPIKFENFPGATFGLGSKVVLGSGGELSNSGTMSAGGVGSIATSKISGLVLQNPDGNTTVDFDFDGGNDLIVINDAAGGFFQGSVRPNPIGGTPTSGTRGRLSFLRSGSALAIGDVTVASTATVDYGLQQSTNGQGREVALLTYAVDYTPWDGSAAAQAKVPGSVREKLNSNHTNFGNSIDGAIAVQSPETSDFVTDLTDFLLTTEDVETLFDSYDRFAPGEIFAPSDTALFSSLRFSENLNSCPKQGSEGRVTFTQQGSCLWLQASGGGIDRQRTGDSIEYDETLFGFSLGGQTALGNGFFAGLAFGYENSNLSNDRFSGDGSRFQGGISVKKEIEATTLSASFSGGVGSYDLSRGVITPSGTVTADSSPNTNWVSAHARVSQVYDVTEELYLKPWFDVGVDHQWQGAYSETGAGDYGLNVGAFDQTLVTLNPMLEVGGGFEIFGAQANASAAAGLLAIVSGRDRSTDVSLLGFGAGGPTYAVSDQVRPLFADIGANLEIVVHERAVVSLGGQALLAGNQQEYGGTGRLSIFF